MHIEIWSDIVCPFCYIGKRRLDQALEQFEFRGAVSIEWRSFQLDPHATAAPGKTQAAVLAEKKGWSLAQTEAAMAQVTELARQAGITYHLDKAVVANTFDAHRLTHLAKRFGLQHAAEERLFQAYFVEGADIGNQQTLIGLGAATGMKPEVVAAMLSGEDLSAEVRADQEAAARAGVQGVPFFVFNNKYAVSGAQPVALFLQVLEKVWEEEQPVQEATGGGFCTTDGYCN